jgi:hypothetical protein
MALVALKIKLDMVHLDMHVGNILFKRNNSEKNWSVRITSPVSGERFHNYIIPNTGYEIAITDFGLAGINNKFANPNFIDENFHVYHPQSISWYDIMTMNRYSDFLEFSKSLYKTYKSTFTEQLLQLALHRFDNYNHTTPVLATSFFEDVYNLPLVNELVQSRKKAPKSCFSMDKPFDPKDIFPFLIPQRSFIER